MLTIEEVSAIVSSCTPESFKSDMENIYKNGPLTYQVLVARLQKYQDHLSVDKPLLRDDVAKKYQIEFYLLIREILEEDDEVRYKLSLDLLNLFFFIYKEDAYLPRYINRYDILEFRNKKHQKSFDNFVTILSTLCDKDNRSKLVGTFPFDELLDRDYIYLNDIQIQNLITYYKGATRGKR